ncbi:MAG: hypothetical protein VW226_13295 [Rhodospirillaceae bacterium]
MVFPSWRPVIGLIKPTMRPGSLEELVRILPSEITIIPLHQNVERGNEEEFELALKSYEEAAARLAEQKVDLIHLAGTPPFMMLKRQGEKRLIAKWQKRFRIKISAAPELDVAALRALSIKNLIGVTYSNFQNELSRNYMKEAGFNVLAMEPMQISFGSAGQISPEMVYSFIRQIFFSHSGADGIYIQGNAWRVLKIIDLLENDLGVPVVHTNCALSWRIQKHFGINAPKQRFGRLISEMP